MQDILSYGESAGLYQRMVKDKKLCVSAFALITDTIDDGLIIIKLKLSNNAAIPQVEKILWEEIENICSKPMQEKELIKIKNAVETSNTIQAMLVSSKSFSLSYYTILGDTDLINREQEIIDSITINDIQQAAQELFQEKMCVLYYLKENKEK